MGAVPPIETAVLFDVVDEERGFVDYGKFGDARRKVRPVSFLDKLAEPVSGMDDEGLPFLPSRIRTEPTSALASFMARSMVIANRSSLLKVT